MNRPDHTFGQDKKKSGETRTLIVVVITILTMGVEIYAGIIYGSMALLADGLHMGSHGAALLITVIAYIMARRYAGDERFNFGTGKINSLAAFTSALLLLGFALLMGWESVERFLSPVPIAFNQAILVAVIGLVVNGISVFILQGSGSHDHHDHGHAHHDHHSDHNLRSAYLHVLADALTSLLAIIALLAAKYFGYNWMDPFMGLVGTFLVTRWSWGLLKISGRVLLDVVPEKSKIDKLRNALEADSTLEVIDLHFWEIGPGIFSAEIILESSGTSDPQEIRKLFPHGLGIQHSSIEIRNLK